MKIYISADIEGVADITHWDEADKSKSDFKRHADQMALEVGAACEGSLNAGADEIWIKDAHGSARNIDHNALPGNVKLIRGWSGHPFSMMQEIDNTFDAALFIGYHSPASSAQSPLSHTTHSKKFHLVRMNGMVASEFLINAYTALYVNVPVVFVSGDDGICEIANSFNDNIKTVSTKKGIGSSVISSHPKEVILEIKNGVESVLESDLSGCKTALPDSFSFEIEYRDHSSAYMASFYPGMKLLSDRKVVFESDDYFDILKMWLFAELV
jgi:D-amino peptidase